MSVFGFGTDGNLSLVGNVSGEGLNQELSYKIFKVVKEAFLKKLSKFPSISN
jgi:hypothetical protein